MSYVEAGMQSVKEADLEFDGSVYDAMISLKVLDFIKACNPALSVKNTLTILDNAKSLLLQMRGI